MIPLNLSICFTANGLPASRRAPRALNVGKAEQLPHGFDMRVGRESLHNEILFLHPTHFRVG
jgi:hypothetical protein